MEGARHTIFVVIGGWPDDSGELREAAGGHEVVVVPAPARMISDEIQGPRPVDGVEPALAPVVTALRAMERARHVLALRMAKGESAVESHCPMTLFISHAKADGVAVAKSLIGVLNHLKAAGTNRVGFDYFYDADHIAPGSVWRSVIKESASRSMLVALRTEAYEGRYWCRREFLAAESRGLPIMVVDLRKEQYHDSALLPFDVVPSVRVHDGNLIPGGAARDGRSFEGAARAEHGTRGDSAPAPANGLLSEEGGAGQRGEQDRVSCPEIVECLRAGGGAAVAPGLRQSAARDVRRIVRN